MQNAELNGKRRPFTVLQQAPTRLPAKLTSLALIANKSLDRKGPLTGPTILLFNHRKRNRVFVDLALVGL